MPSRILRRFRLALSAAIFVGMALPSASANPFAKAGKAAACSSPAGLARLDQSLVRTSRRMAAGDAITIVALGSSSTAGAGATSPDRSYPSRLADELRRRFPGHAITVLNRGANGEEVEDMVARLDESVLAEKPDLVLWQVGTNAVMRDQDLVQIGAAIHDGLARIKASGADVILMDPQFAPQVLAKAEIGPMISLIATLANLDQVDLFRRFAVMRSWHDISGIPFETFVSSDKLHMNDWGYGCIARIFAGAIAEAASRPVITAIAARR